jgi:hypothetical protein
MLPLFGVITQEVRNKANIIFVFAPYWEREVGMAESVGVYAVIRRDTQMCVLRYVPHYLHV